jgi:hypothetical protein
VGRKNPITSAASQAQSTRRAKKKATFNLDADLHHQLKVTAALYKREMLELVEEALRRYLKTLRRRHPTK